MRRNQFQIDLDTYSDFYKSVYGFRPRHIYEWTREQLDAEFAKLKVESEAEDKRRIEAEEKAIEELTSQIANAGLPVAEAIAQLHTKHNTNGDDEFLDYNLHVPFGTIAKLRVAAL